MANPISSAASAAAAFLSGKSPDQAAGVQTTSADDAAREDVGDDAPVVEDTSDDYNQDDALDISDSEADESEDADVSDADAESESDDSEEKPDADDTSDVEEVEITDEHGRRRVRVDFSNREYRKKLVQQAAGARKLMRVEIPKLRKELESVRADLTSKGDDAEIGRSLSDAWDKGGMAGLVAALTKGKQTWDEVFEAERLHRDELRKLSPDARRAYDAEQAAKQAVATKSEAEKKLEAKLADFEAREAANERATLQGYMDAPFSKHRFAGKLGDEAREHRLDSMMWNQVRADVAALDDDVPVTAQLVGRLFSEHAAALRQTIQAEVRKETRDVLDTKRQAAKETAQSRMRASDSKSTSDEKKLAASMRTGDFVSGVAAFLSRGKQNGKKRA